MKTTLILLLIIMIMGACAVTASAGSLGVNVPPGVVLEMTSVITANGNCFYPAVIAGINDQLALGVMYYTSLSYFTVSGRYCPAQNLSADLYYRFFGTGSWKAALRGKTFLNQKLALAGMVSYDSVAPGSLGALGQAEYCFSENWVGNAGLSYANSSACAVLGVDYTSGNWAAALNCILPTDNFNHPMIELVLDYLIKNNRLNTVLPRVRARR